MNESDKKLMSLWRREMLKADASEVHVLANRALTYATLGKNPADCIEAAGIYFLYFLKLHEYESATQDYIDCLARDGGVLGFIMKNKHKLEEEDNEIPW